MENTALILQTQPTQTQAKSTGTTGLTLLPSPAPVRVALFGVGRWGSHWLRKFLDHPQADLVAVVDPCESRLITLNRQYELERQAITITTDWQAALRQSNLDAVAIVTPAATHYALIRAALEQGYHVLAEKPLTLDLAESLALCQLAAQQQRQLVVDHTYLFHAAVQRGRTVIQQGALGDLRYGYAARTHLGPVRQDVNALWDLAIHDIAIFNSWLNAMPIEVQAQGTCWLQPDLADLVWVKLTYASGFEAYIHLCWSNADKQRRLSVVGSQGTLIFDEMAESSLMLLQGSLEQQSGSFIPTGQANQAMQIEPIEPLQAVCTHFLTCVQENRASEISSGWLGAQLVQILAALRQSLQQGGKPIALDPILGDFNFRSEGSDSRTSD